MKDKYGNILTPKKGNNARLSESVIEKTLRKTYGNQTKAANLLKCDRSTISRRVNESPYLKAVAEELIESRLDTTEDVLKDLIDEKELGAVCFYLKTIGKRRGYIESKQTEESDLSKMKELADFFSRVSQVKSPDEA